MVRAGLERTFCNLLIWAALFVATNSAIAQENAVWSAETGNSSAASDEKIASVFASRMGDGETDIESEDDFILTDNGIVRSKDAPKNYYNMVVEKPTKPKAAALPMRAVNTTAENGAASVPTCSPSPRSADELEAMIEAEAVKQGVEVGFVKAVARAESGIGLAQNSPAGARGILQLMPGTADRYGVADVCDDAQNIEGAVAYMSDLFAEFGNPMLVAAAYNAGEGRVREYGGIPPFQETLNYVAEVTGYQMGLAKPKRRAKSTSRKQSVNVSAQNEGSTGVLSTKGKKGQFVGGVMHF